MRKGLLWRGPPRRQPPAGHVPQLCQRLAGVAGALRRRRLRRGGGQQVLTHVPINTSCGRRPEELQVGLHALGTTHLRASSWTLDRTPRFRPAPTSPATYGDDGIWGWSASRGNTFLACWSPTTTGRSSSRQSKKYNTMYIVRTTQSSLFFHRGQKSSSLSSVRLVQLQVVYYIGTIVLKRQVMTTGWREG